MSSYYNEIDPYAAQWLRNLIAAGHIAPSHVDERSIADVKASDLAGYTQCHFFAGIGVWSHALKLAGWPDDRPVWTGSCPCQPFSAAGKGEGVNDPRHLWPEWFRLIRECRPVAIFGEQVSAAVRHGWLDDVSTDLEGLGYAVGAADFPACSVGAPHIRQRLYFVADSEHTERRPQRRPEQDERDGHDAGRSEAHGQSGACSEVRGMAESESAQLDRSGNARRGRGEPANAGDMGDADRAGSQGRRLLGATGGRDSADQRAARTPGPTNGFWRDAEWLPCRDGKARPTKPGTFPLAHGAPQRVGRLRAYGNAICAPQAAEFVAAFLGAQQ